MTEIIKKVVVLSLKLVNYILVIALGSYFAFSGMKENMDGTFTPISPYFGQMSRGFLIIYFLVAIISLIIFLIDFMGMLNYLGKKNRKSHGSCNNPILIASDKTEQFLEDSKQNVIKPEFLSECQKLSTMFKREK